MNAAATGLVVGLDEPAPAGVVGGKLSGLAGLRRAGFAVPAGYAVTVPAYRRHLAETGLDELAGRVGAALRADDEAALEAAAGRLREAFAATPVAGPVRDAVAAAYRALCEERGRDGLPVAVRSSAVGEDGGAASFAGVFDTVLGVHGADAVVEAVRGCWASLYAPRALAYRRRRAAGAVDMPMAVGVLELVPARCSGIAFSAHPVTARRDRVLIEANWGWGEAVVQGLVTPDHVEVDTVGGRVERHDVAHKTVMSGPDPAGGPIRTVPVPEPLRNRPVLNEAQIMAVAAAVRRVERHEGRPVDVEWVLDDARPAGRLWIVQARPITA
ncbi:PEP/pyruvate-binding domain-containing protein [Dactylosporangium sp. CA-092794]|uniref:PEP/pyruvate-binding domain-containing protein n=1 Tax=Dactylosporangium sp. CA-092794 TaxID=3239929 RepID=UPI003D8E5942